MVFFSLSLCVCHPLMPVVASRSSSSAILASESRASTSPSLIACQSPECERCVAEVHLYLCCPSARLRSRFYTRLTLAPDTRSQKP